MKEEVVGCRFQGILSPRAGAVMEELRVVGFSRVKGVFSGVLAFRRVGRMI